MFPLKVDLQFTCDLWLICVIRIMWVIHWKNLGTCGQPPVLLCWWMQNLGTCGQPPVLLCWWMQNLGTCGQPLVLLCWWMQNLGTCGQPPVLLCWWMQNLGTGQPQCSCAGGCRTSVRVVNHSAPVLVDAEPRYVLSTTVLLCWWMQKNVDASCTNKMCLMMTSLTVEWHVRY